MCHPAPLAIQVIVDMNFVIVVLKIGKLNVIETIMMQLVHYAVKYLNTDLSI